MKSWIRNSLAMFLILYVVLGHVIGRNTAHAVQDILGQLNPPIVLPTSSVLRIYGGVMLTWPYWKWLDAFGEPEPVQEPSRKARSWTSVMDA